MEYRGVLCNIYIVYIYIQTKKSVKNNKKGLPGGKKKFRWYRSDDFL